MKVIGRMVTSEVRSMTQKSGNRDLIERRKVWLLCFFFVVLIKNIMLLSITDDVFMHLVQVGSGQVRSTGRGPAWYS